MGKFAHLLEGKGKDVKIGETTFTIKPLSNRYLGYFMVDQNDQQAQHDALLKMITVSLQQTDPEITEEDVKELPMKETNKIMEVINDVNELT